MASLLLPLLLLLLLPLLGHAASENSTTSLRIVGGEPVPNPNPFPWMVQIIFRDENLDNVGLCGGSLIQPNVVLTAAHCFEGDVPFGISLCTSRISAEDDPQDRLCIFDLHTDIIIHPQYDSMTTKNDIALLIASEDIPMDIAVPKYPLLASSQPPVGTVVTVAGWGHTSNEGNPAHVLRYVELEVQPTSVCESEFPSMYAPTVEMCAGVKGGGKDSCQGDSGGPLFVVNDCCEYPSVTQIGIVSFGPPCATSSGAVYTRVDAFLDWIEDEVGTIDNTPACCSCDGSPKDIGKSIDCEGDDHAHTADDFYHLLTAILTMSVWIVILLFLISMCMSAVIWKTWKQNVEIVEA